MIDSTTTQTTLTTTAAPTAAVAAQLDALHASYVTSVNIAVAADDFTLADELAAAYDRDATELLRQSEDLAA